MVEYKYENKNASPNLDGIHLDVVASAMTDKNIEYCRWDEDIAELKVWWADSLSGGDKTILDTIVANNS